MFFRLHPTVGRDDHTTPQTSPQPASTKPLTGFAAGVQANNAGYRRLVEKPSFGNYVGRKFVGGAAEAVEGTANAAGYWYQGMVKSGELQHNNALRGAAASTKNPYAKAAMESHIDKYGINAQQAENITQRPTKTLTNFGDNYVAETEEKFADADFGKVGNLIGDVAQGAGGMLAKMPTRLVPGLGEVITFASAYGNAKQSALKNGAVESEASIYALGTATVELATEKMFGFAGSLGGGAADNALTWFVNKVAKSEAGKTALNIIIGAVGEGAEEFIAEYGQKYIDKLTTKMDERSWKEVSKDAWYNALVGGITSVLFGTADIIRGGNGKLPTAEDLESVTAQAAEETASSIARGDSVTLRKMVTESESERNERLKNASIKITAAQKGSGEHFDKSMLSGVRKQDAGKYLAPILRKLGIFTKYQNPALDVSFEYSGNGLRRSLGHQEQESGKNFDDLALVNANLKELCENAYPAEAHVDEKPPTSDGHVQAAATLFSVLQDGERLIPVKMTVKFFDNRDPTLHILIASNKTQNKSTNVNTVGTQIDAQHIADGTLTNISVADFLEVVNGSEQFTKRMPSLSGRTTSEQFPLLYTEQLLKQAKRNGNLYTQRLLQRQIEKAMQNSRKTEFESIASMPTIYADHIKSREAELQRLIKEAEEDFSEESFYADARDKLGEIVARGTTKIKQGFTAFSKDDVLFERAKLVKPDGNKFDVAMHGTSQSVAFGGREVNMSPRLLAAIIKHNKDYNGQEIRLLSCNTGRKTDDDYCFAEELANALGVTVYAPNDLLIFNDDGTFEIGRNNKGFFNAYKPNERRRLK